MPINTDGASESIRFKYVHEIDESYVLLVEYHHTETGPTITIHNFLEDQDLSLPLGLFTDTVDFLRGRGTVSGGSSPKQPVVLTRNRLAPTKLPSVSRPSVNKKPSAPPLPIQPPVQEIASYVPQHSILSASGAIEGAINYSESVPNEDMTPQISEGQGVPDSSDPTANHDPSFTLEAAKIKKAAGNKKPGLKRVGSARSISSTGDNDIDVEIA